MRPGNQPHASPVLRTLNGVWPGCLPADGAGPGSITIVALIVAALCLALLPLPWWLAFGAAVAAAVVAWRVAERTPLWYAATIGIPIPQAVFLARLSMADLFILPSIVRDSRRWVRGTLPQSSLRKPLLLLVGITIVATVVGYIRTRHWSMWGLLNRDAGLVLQIATLFAISARLRTFEDIRRVSQWYVIGVSLANLGMLLGVAVKFLGVPNSLYTARLSGWMSQPTVTGGLLLVAVMLELGSLTAARKPAERRALRWGNLWLLGISLGLTVSRSAWLAASGGAAVLLAVLWLRDRARVPRPRVLHSAATLVWVLLPSLFLGNVLVANLTARVPLLATDRRDDLRAELTAKCLDRPELDYCVGPLAPPAEARRPTTTGTALAPAPPRARPEGSAPPSVQSETPAPPPAAPLTMPDVVMNARGLSDRVAILRWGWQEYTSDWQSVLFGIGLGTFYATSDQAFGLPLIIHNTFAWYLFEFGPIGLAIVVWIWGRTAGNIFSATKQSEEPAALALGLTAAFGAFAVFCLFNEGFYQRQFWLVMVLADRLAALPKAKVDLAVTAATAA